MIVRSVNVAEVFIDLKPRNIFETSRDTKEAGLPVAQHLRTDAEMVRVTRVQSQARGTTEGLLREFPRLSGLHTYGRYILCAGYEKGQTGCVTLESLTSFAPAFHSLCFNNLRMPLSSQRVLTRHVHLSFPKSNGSLVQGYISVEAVCPAIAFFHKIRNIKPFF